ncbi:hypothetical protein O181_048313 [Austropuccinia psidii MF-1]|uniref:Uncharacterized protein n=1 Tax=Austropuccinia psidii MF-1 TaxID=1389203 RepID=A0A9Q3HKD9_9BASI|nr:hypothetical protein [Austropuccinia psidii MF-1]
MSQKMVHMKILQRCGGELENFLRTRHIEPCCTEKYINALEDIVTRTKIGRTWKTLDIESSNKPFIKKDRTREPFKPNIPHTKEQREFHKCGGIGHLANNSSKRQKLMEFAFETNKEPLGAIIGNEVEIVLNVEKPYPPLLRRPAYPASPRAREALEVNIKELMDLGVLRKVGHNEQVEVTTLVIIAWHNGKRF